MSTAVGLYPFRSWPFPAENDLLQMVLLQKPHLFYGIKYGFVAMLFSIPYIASSILFSFTCIFVGREKQIPIAGHLIGIFPHEKSREIKSVSVHPKNRGRMRMRGRSTVRYASNDHSKPETHDAILSEESACCDGGAEVFGAIHRTASPLAATD